jgi:TPR repeat protein
MILDLGKKLDELFQQERFRKIWIRSTLGMLAILALLFLLLFITFALAFFVLATRSPAGCTIGLLLLALWGAVIFAFWMNRNTDARYSKEVLRLMERAQHGDSRAQYRLAECYLQGTPGIPRSSSEAIHWLQQSAQGGEAQAAYVLAGLLKTGNGALVDETEARQWLAQAIESGHAPSRERLARWDRGEPEPLPTRAMAPPPVEAEAPPTSPLRRFYDRLPPWLREGPWVVAFLVSLLGVIAYACAAFVALVLLSYTLSPEATLGIAIIFLAGLGSVSFILFLFRGREASYTRSSRRLIRRAESGNGEAQRLLAQAYMEGRLGLPRDASQALWWLQHCAEGGDLQAAYQLAQWIEQGLGHHRNRALALQWLQRAAGGGYGPAKVLMERWKRQDAENVWREAD